MLITIEKEKLKLLLDSYATIIGIDKNTDYANLVSNASLFISIYIAEYPHELLRYLFAVFAIWVIVMTVKKILQADNKSADTLYNDITSLDETAHRYSLVAIKDTFNKYPNHFLVYYNEKWDCKFFFSFKTIPSNDIANLRERISNELKIPQESISLEKRAERTQRKFAPADSIQKSYAHTLYYAEIKDIPAEYQHSLFSIGSRQYYWLTIDEMEMDEQVRERNMDVVSFVKECIP